MNEQCIKSLFSNTETVELDLSLIPGDRYELDLEKINGSLGLNVAVSYIIIALNINSVLILRVQTEVKICALKHVKSTMRVRQIAEIA